MSFSRRLLAVAATAVGAGALIGGATAGRSRPSLRPVPVVRAAYREPPAGLNARAPPHLA